MRATVAATDLAGATALATKIKKISSVQLMADVSTGTLMVSGADEYGDIVLRADIGADVTDSGRVTVADPVRTPDAKI